MSSFSSGVLSVLVGSLATLILTRNDLYIFAKHLRELKFELEEVEKNPVGKYYAVNP